MGRNRCPRCGANDRSHEVKVEVRLGNGYRSEIKGAGIRVCVNCAAELRDQIAAIFAVARDGISAFIDEPTLREAEDERQEDMRALDGDEVEGHV